MQALPYSIYINKRPPRIAFLVNPKKCNSQELDAIFNYNQGKWGGRFNPIIFTDGKTIEEKWWKFLRDIDPDVVKSLIPLQDKLLKKIDVFLSPYSIEVPHKVRKNSMRYSISLSDEGLSILPTPDNVFKISPPFMSNSKLVLFKLTQTNDKILQQFIQRNFGIYTSDPYIEKALCGIETKVFSIANRESLSSAFTELSAFGRFTHLIQICSLPNTFQDVEYDRMGEVFTVVIGDSPEDIAYFWNRVLLIPNVKRTDLKQIWLPVELACDTEIESALKKWLLRAADPGGTTNEEIQFVSFSLGKSELDKIADRLTKNICLRRTITIFNEPQIPNFQAKAPHLYFKEDLDLHRVTGNDVYVGLNEPEVTKGIMRDEHWMVDVYIEFRPERYSKFTRKDFWWQLPQRNYLAHCIFHKPSRICSDGFPAVLMKRGEPTLNIELPDDTSIFQILITRRNTPYYTADPRSKFAYEPFYDAKPSDKGRYLSGFLGLFSRLSFAYGVLGNRYWRHMFSILSHQNPSKDENRQESILNKLKKKLQRCGKSFLEKPENLEWLSNYVLQLSKEQAATGKELSFKAFVKEAEKELKEFNSSRERDQKIKFDKQDVKDEISDLIESNILFVGVRPYCSLCGCSDWHHVNETQQILQCKGCRYEYPIRSEEKWYYKLNNLVQIGCAQHGLIPIVLVLGELSREHRSSFIMRASSDLFKRRESKPFGELDIVCIQDGKFIIGEVKQSIKGFTESDFSKMAEIAKRLKPDMVIFSSLDIKCNRFVNDNIATLKEKLVPLGIDVSWYQLPSYIFEASPVR